MLYEVITPGEIKVELKKNGYKALARTVTLEKFTSERISFDMEKTDINTVVIQTFPDAADIYLDSVWVGKCPVPRDFDFVEVIGIVGRARIDLCHKGDVVIGLILQNQIKSMRRGSRDFVVRNNFV